ncbi:MAG: hypothetical protein IT395_07360 [Candidatus Omnitrophica bacterium]|nr:hypothetical protein [Candidatus Omnitrophota bacterium]
MANLFGPITLAQAKDLVLADPQQIIGLSEEYNPPLIKGLKVYPDNPLEFDFILDQGDDPLSADSSKEISSRLIKYFLAALTVPEKELWVNLSPFEKDRIIPEAFGLTEMGRDLLAEDYLLKQVTASLLYPDDEIGQRFWSRVKQLAKEKFGTNNIPANTTNKVWIVPGKALIYENAQNGTAFIVESQLKVMLEEDYVALAHQKAKNEGTKQSVSAEIASHPTDVRNDVNAIGSQIIREIVVPELTREINENKNFAKLRQIYSSYILANWYKQKIKNSLLNQVYYDQNKVAGVDIDDPNDKQKIYEHYLQAFTKGAYNYIQEDYDPVTDEMIPRKYFSGGVNLAWSDLNLETTDQPPSLTAQASSGIIVVKSMASPDLNGAKPPRFDWILNPSTEDFRDSAPLDLIDPENPNMPPETAQKVALIANELDLEYNHAAVLLGEFMTRADEIAQASGQEILFNIENNLEEHDGVTMPGITFSYRILVDDDSEGVDIGRFKINRKDANTLLLSGLYSRDIRQPEGTVLIIAPFINFDYNLKETKDGFTALSLDLIEKLGPLTAESLYRTDFSAPKLLELLIEFYGEEFISSVSLEAADKKMIFNQVLQNRLGGRDYASIPLGLKILARAAVGLTKQQIKEAPIRDPRDFIEIAQAFNTLPRKYSPSQMFAPNKAMTDSLIKGARALKALASAWDMRLELQVAIPDGLQNYLLYKAFRFDLVLATDETGEPTNEKDTYIKKVIDEIHQRVRAKKDGEVIDVNTIVWDILRKNKFQHVLGTMNYDPKNENTEVDLLNPYVRQEIEALFQPYIASLEMAIGEPVSLTLSELVKKYYFYEAPGYKITLSVPTTTADGLTSQFDMATINLNSARGTLWVSGLSIQEPAVTDEEKVLVTSNDADFNFKPSATRTAVAEFREALRNKIGQEKFDRLMAIDLGEEHYAELLRTILGKFYNEALQDRIAFQGTPAEKNFNDYLDQEISAIDYRDIPTVLKVLAITGVGLTEKQIKELDIDPDYGLNEIAAMLNIQTRPYFPTQRYPSVSAMQDALNGISKALPLFARNAGFARVNAEVSLPDAFQNFLLYLTLGYDLQPQREMPLLTQVVQFYLGNHKIIPGLQAMSWAIYRGVPEFIGIQRTIIMTFDLNGEQTKRKALEKLQEFSQLVTAGLPYYQKYYPGRVKDMSAPIGPLLNKPTQPSSASSSPVGGIDLDPSSLVLITQNTSGEIEFNVNPLVLQQLQNVPGFTPVILNIQPMQNLQLFLGTNPAAN